MSSTDLSIKLKDNLEWKFKKEKNGIKIYTRDLSNSNLKELKITMSFEGTSFMKIIDLLKKADKYTEWVYKCSDSKLAVEIDEQESVSYYKFDFPWPLSDRDAYMKSVIKRDDARKRLTVTTTSLPRFGAEEESVVRIQDHFNEWQFEEETNNRIKLTYYIKSDPAGKIPDWAVNLAVDRGPTTSLTNFRNMLRQ